MDVMGGWTRKTRMDLGGSPVSGLAVDGVPKSMLKMEENLVHQSPRDSFVAGLVARTMKRLSVSWPSASPAP